MNQVIYPVPPSHKTFSFGNVIIDSNFDSGNCSHAQKVSATNYNLWIATDHPKNNYRTWFHFSIQGLNKGTSVTFKIKNMQNQSRLLNQGLVPVYRENGSQQWKRIKQKVNTASIEFNQGWIQWSFKHTMTSNQKVFFAFFYPWSNQQNDKFLKIIEERCKANPNIYFHRTSITKSLEGRPIQFLTISSKKGISNKQQGIQDKNLFVQKQRPKGFNCDKKCIVVGARVHPGQVPSSHVMTGIIDELTKDNQVANALRDRTVFYIFPIFNPDGVSRGHYRVDTNGINLNRCYINPNPKQHSPIYAVKKFIMYLHQKNRYFGFLDLHAHASRKGMFIYGNSTNQLQKQVQTCLFPKILSMNSQNFQYEGSNFTQKNMYVKDRGDHVSKQGAGRVAIFKATKNAFSWTLECNYNMNRVTNVIQPQKSVDQKKLLPNQSQLEDKIIVPYKYPTHKQPTEFYTIQTYRKLGKQICESFLDLLQANPISRIQNPTSHYKSIQYLKMNLAVALLRMAPNRFQAPYKKIYHGIQSTDNPELYKRSIQALYLLMIKKAKIPNLNQFLKNNNRQSIIMPIESKKIQNRKFTNRAQSFRPIKSFQTNSLQPVKAMSIQSQKQTAENQQFKQLQETIKLQRQKSSHPKIHYESAVYIKQNTINPSRVMTNSAHNKVKSHNLSFFSWQAQPQANQAKKVMLHIQEFKMIGINKLRNSLGAQMKVNRPKGGQQYNFRSSKPVKLKFQQLPTIQSVKGKSSIKIVQTQTDPKSRIGRTYSKQLIDFEDQKF